MLSGQVKPLNSTETLGKTTYSYLIVRAWLLVLRKRCQPVADKGLDGGQHAIWNPILADTQVQTAKFEKGS